MNLHQMSKLADAREDMMSVYGTLKALKVYFGCLPEDTFGKRVVSDMTEDAFLKADHAWRVINRLIENKEERP